MAIVQIKRRTSTTYLELAATIHVPQVQALYKLLVKVLARNLAIVLAADKVKHIDTAGLQVLIAFYREAQKRGLDFRWETPSPELCEAAKLLSLEKTIGLEI